MSPADHQRQRCKACDRADKFNFYVPDEVWSAVVPEPLQGRVICLGCFDGFAKERAVPYATALQEVWFAGEAATFRFSPDLALD